MTFASIPSPSISTFQIGPVTIHIYALCILAGIVVAVAIATRRWKRVGGDFDQVLDLAIVSVFAGIIGARLYHVITTPERFFGPDGDLMEIVRIWNGGLGIWGGVAFGLVAAWLWCRHKHYPFALLADAVAPALLVAQAIGRLGNWFNRELYGSATTLPWGLDVDGSGTLYHPTFLYEMIWNLIGAALIVWIGHRAAYVIKAGSLMTIYVMWYTAGRTWIETLRIDYAHEFLGVRINVWVSMGVFVCGVIAFVVVQRVGSRTEALAERLRAVTAAELHEQSDDEPGHQGEADGQPISQTAEEPRTTDDVSMTFTQPQAHTQASAGDGQDAPYSGAHGAATVEAAAAPAPTPYASRSDAPQPDSRPDTVRRSGRNG